MLVQDGKDFGVRMAPDEYIGELKERINEKQKYPQNANDLTLYRAKSKETCPNGGVIHVLVIPPEPNASRPPLASELVEQLQRGFIASLEKKRKCDEEEAERVKKMKISSKVRVADDEYQLDALAQSTRVVKTPGLHSFWAGYGDFPESYFVRKEEVTFWQVVKRMLTSIDDDNWPRIILVGSSGVGKTCFLILIGFYLAGFAKHKVIIVRRLKYANLVNAVVVLDGTGSEIRAEKYTNLTGD